MAFGVLFGFQEFIDVLFFLPALRTTVRNPSYFGRVSFSLIADAAEKNDLSVLPKCTKPCSICDRYILRSLACNDCMSALFLQLDLALFTGSWRKPSILTL